MDEELRSLERSNPQRHRFHLHRSGQLKPKDWAIGDIVELGPLYDYQGDLFSETFFGAQVPVEALVVGVRLWKKNPGKSPIVVGLPPRWACSTASGSRVTKIIQVGINVEGYREWMISSKRRERGY